MPSIRSGWNQRTSPSVAGQVVDAERIASSSVSALEPNRIMRAASQRAWQS